MPTAYSAPVRENLRKYQQGSRAKQKAFLQKYNFRKEPINYPSEIQAGDHLTRKGGSGIFGYFHHMLCTGKSQDQVTIVEYTGPYSGFSAVPRSVAGKDLTVFGKIVEQTYPVQEFLKKKILKIIWPDELRKCYSVEEVIKRAKTRIGETCYDFLKNNCEHFVRWSICGLNVSLQVESWYLWARDIVYSIFAGIYDSVKKAMPRLGVKIVANASDEVVGFICMNPEMIGFGLGILLEAGLAGYEIYKAFNDHNENKRQFWANLAEILFKTIGRVGGGIGGSLLGLYVFPAGGLLSSYIGGAIGAGVGYFFGAFIACRFENCHYLDG